MNVINDDQEFVGAKSRFGRAIKTYDDTFGPLWVYRDSMGLHGIVRAQHFHEAYEIVLDSILTPISEDEVKEMVEDAKEQGLSEGDLPEGYHHQPNCTGTGIVMTDLNGDYLNELTPELVKELEITLDIKEEE